MVRKTNERMHAQAGYDSDRSVTVISDSEEEREHERQRQRQRDRNRQPHASTPHTPRKTTVVYENGRDVIVISDSEEDDKGLDKGRRRHSSTVCKLDDDEVVPSSQPDEIEVDWETLKRQPSVMIPRRSLENTTWQKPLTPSEFGHHTETTELSDEDDGMDMDDGAIINFDSSKNRRPLNRIDSPAKSRLLPAAGPSTPKTPAATPRKKKANTVLDRRLQLAHELFAELNEHVFDQGIFNVDIKWNPRFLTTAGRAKWTKSRDGIHSSILELSPKVIDSDERLQNTVSHEMCHLASWMIDKDPTEQHGSLWTAWTRKVMKYRPDIHISARHEYEIAFKFNWKCTAASCSNTFGRHSKSIDPKKVMCPCGGLLEAMFEQSTRRKPGSSSSSRLASTAPPQASPIRSPMSRGAAKGCDRPMVRGGGDANDLAASSPTTPSRRDIPSHFASDDDGDCSMDELIRNMSKSTLQEKD